MLETIKHELGEKIQYSVIWLHGLGADGHDFEPIVPELQLGNDAGVRFIFPHAPIKPITVNNGMSMRAWYDITSLTSLDRVDLPGMMQSEKLILQLIEQEIQAGIASENIILAGFSQGGAMALHTGLRFEKKLAGIIALSCYLPDAASLPSSAQSANATTPIFQAHGTMDPVVAFQFGQLSHEWLVANGYKVSWHTYPMMHAVCYEEIVALGEWMKQRLLLNDQRFPP